MKQRQVIVLSKNQKSSRLWPVLSPSSYAYVNPSEVRTSLFSKMSRKLSSMISTSENSDVERAIAESILRKYPGNTAFVSLDNSITLMAEVGKLRQNSPLILVQHGNNYHAYNQPVRQTLDNAMLLCWGQREVDSYSLRGVRPRLFQPVGSLLSALEPIKKARDAQSMRPRVCLVSEFRTDSETESESYMLERLGAWSTLMRALRDAHSELDLEIVVAVRPLVFGSGNNLEEQKTYFEQHLGFRPSFSDELGYTSSYDLIDSSTVVVGLQSALLFEALARGIRTIMCFPQSENLTLVPAISGLAKLHLQSSTDLINRLTRVVKTSRTEYFQSLRPSPSYFIRENVDTVSVIRSCIQSIERGHELSDCLETPT